MSSAPDSQPLGSSPPTGRPSVSALGAIAWLKGNSLHELEQLSQRVSLRHLPAGSSFSIPTTSALLVLEGALSTEGTTQLGRGTLLGAPAWWSDNATPLPVTVPSACTVGLLDQTSFEHLAEEAPAVALRLLRHALTGDGNLLRHLPRGQSVQVELPDGRRRVPAGTQLRELLPETDGGLPVVAALVDRKATALCSTLTTNGKVTPLTPHEWEGQRVVRHSFALLALEAAQQIASQQSVKMGPSVGFGQRILVPGLSGEELGAFSRELEAKMSQLVQQDLPLRQEMWTYGEARQYFLDEDWEDAARLLETWRDTAVPLVRYGNVRAIEMGPLLPNTGMFDGFHVLADNDFLLLVYGHRPKTPTRPTRTMPAMALREVGETRQAEAGQSTRGFLMRQARSAAGPDYEVTFEEQNWLRALGVSSVGTFNHACVRGNVPDLIRVSEGFQEKKLTVIADEIFRRRDEIDIVTIAGPSSSGKTTFIRRLCVQLKVNGITPVALGLDDYYVDRNQTPLDASGDFDFEALEALKLDLLHEHIAQLLRGQGVNTPRYDFKAGKSLLNQGKPIQLRPRDVLLVEGIHGLNPHLLGDVPPRRVFRVFVCPMMQLSFDHASRVHASDVRLIRRIVRDRHHRGNDASETIERWPKVRAGERRHIYPHQTNADAVFDTSLVYELSVLRVYAERYLLEVPRDHASFTTAYRLMHLLDRFVSIYPDHVPPTSILREFIGGSGFDY